LSTTRPFHTRSRVRSWSRSGPPASNFVDALLPRDGTLGGQMTRTELDVDLYNDARRELQGMTTTKATAFEPAVTTEGLGSATVTTSMPPGQSVLS